MVQYIVHVRVLHCTARYAGGSSTRQRPFACRGRLKKMDGGASYIFALPLRTLQVLRVASGRSREGGGESHLEESRSSLQLSA